MPRFVIVRRALSVVSVEQATAPQPGQHSQLDRMPYRLEIGAVGDGQLVKHDALPFLATEDAIRHSRRG